MLLVRVQAYRRNGLPAGAPFNERLSSAVERFYKLSDDQLADLAAGQGVTVTLGSKSFDLDPLRGSREAATVALRMEDRGVLRHFLELRP